MLNLDIFSIINAKGVPSLCNLKLQQYSILYVQTLHNDCSHIEDVHLLFCAHLINIFLFLTGVELRHFFLPRCLVGCLVCVICNSQQSSLLYIQTSRNDCSHIDNVHLPFCAHLINIFLFLGLLNLDIFSHPKCLRGVLFV